MWMFLRCVGKKANPFLVPLCLLWRAALAFVSETWLICCALTFSFHPSVKACTQLLETNLILILFQHSPCSARYSLTLFMPCLTFHRKHIFLFKRKIKKKCLSLFLCSAAALSTEYQCLGSSWCYRAQLEKSQGLTAGCTLDSLSTFVRAQWRANARSSRTAQSPASDFNPLSIGVLQEALQGLSAPVKRFRNFLCKPVWVTKCWVWVTRC